VIVALLVVLLLLLSVSLYRPNEPPYFLSYTDSNYSVTFVSGNFSAAVTKDMPRVVFSHTNAVLSPEFALRDERLYLFNDSNHDGLFTMNEVLFTSYIDAHHTVWTFSKVQSGDDRGNNWSEVSVQGNVSLYKGLDDVPATPAVTDWAAVDVHYRISERDSTHSNPMGTYIVHGMTEMNVSFTITLLKHLAVDGIALQHYLIGGGSTNDLLLREGMGAGQGLSNVSSSVDETVLGPNFTHRFIQTNLPCQDVYFAREDGIAQAFYHFSSFPTNGSGGRVGMNSSFYTDGAGMFLFQAFFLTNDTDRITEESSVGIDESGFNVTVKDWFHSNFAILMVVCGTIAAVVLFTAFVVLYRRYKKADAKSPNNEQEERKSP